MKIEKTPIGTRPFFIPAEDRIKELAAAILENADSYVIGCIMEWAKEIIEQCRLIYNMQNRKAEDY